MLETLTRSADLRALPASDARLAIGVRLWVVLGKLDRDPLPPLCEQLGSATAAVRLHLLLEQVGTAWVDPFCINPPCCPQLSFDEKLVLDMVARAASGDRPGFDRLLSDLLGGDTRERLYDSARRFCDAIPVPPPGHRCNSPTGRSAGDGT